MVLELPASGAAGDGLLGWLLDVCVGALLGLWTWAGTACGLMAPVVGVGLRTSR